MQPQNEQEAPNDTGVTDYGKCLETGKRQNSLNTESVWKQEKQPVFNTSMDFVVSHVSRHFPGPKSENIERS